MWKKVEFNDRDPDGFGDLEEYVHENGVSKKILLAQTKSNSSRKRNKVGKKISNKAKPVEKKNDSTPVDTSVEYDLTAWLQLKLSRNIAEHLCSNGLLSPQPVQAQAIPVSIAHKKDVFVASETGSGKTLCYLLPLLQLLLHIKPYQERKTDFEAKFFATNKVRAIIITPTRELAMQVVNEFNKLLKPFFITCAAIVGGISENKQIRILGKFRPEVIVATPGRLWDFISSLEEVGDASKNSKIKNNPDFNGSVRYLSDVKGLRLFVIDEIDRLLDAGHFKEFTKISSFISMNCGDSRRYKIFSYSATLSTFLSNFTKVTPKNDKNVNHLFDLLRHIHGGGDNFQLVDLSHEKLTNINLNEYKCFCDTTEEKVFTILMFINFLENDAKDNIKLIIFVNSIRMLKVLTHCLKLFKLSVTSLHSKKLQKIRLKAVESFRDQFSANPVDILVCTDLAARGLDFDSVDGVVQFEVPKSVDTYVHRGGRTARNGKHGSNLLLVGVHEMEVYKKMLGKLNRVDSMPSFDVCLIGKVKMQTYFDKKKRLMQKSKIGWKIAELENELELMEKDEGWLRKNARSLDILDGEFEGASKKSKKKLLFDRKRRELSMLKAEFNHF